MCSPQIGVKSVIKWMVIDVFRLLKVKQQEEAWHRSPPSHPEIKAGFQDVRFSPIKWFSDSGLWAYFFRITGESKGFDICCYICWIFFNIVNMAHGSSPPTLWVQVQFSKISGPVGASSLWWLMEYSTGICC